MTIVPLLFFILAFTAEASDLIVKKNCFYKRSSWFHAITYHSDQLRNEVPHGSMPPGLYHKIDGPNDINVPISEMAGMNCYSLRASKAIHEKYQKEIDTIRDRYEGKVVIREDFEAPLNLVLTNESTVFKYGGIFPKKFGKYASIKYQAKDKEPFRLELFQYQMERVKFDKYVGSIPLDLKKPERLEDLYVRAHHVAPDIVKFIFTLGSKSGKEHIFHVGTNEALEIPMVYWTITGKFPLPIPDYLAALHGNGTFYNWPLLMAVNVKELR